MNKVSTRSVARHLLSWLTIIVLLMTALPAVAQDPDGQDGEQDTLTVSAAPSSGRVALPTAPQNPAAVLWDQPLSTINHNAYANQDFVNPANDAHDIFIADDFANTNAWAIDTIFVPGNTWKSGSTGCDLTCANTLHWQIYADAGGVPDGDPYGGGNPPVWSLSLPPTDSHVTLSAGLDGWLSNVTLSLNTPINLPSGTWWLVFYPTMEFAPCAQYGRHVADTTNGYVAQVINPGGGFGFPTTWTPVTAPSTWDLTRQDLAFRLEGIPVPPGPLVYDAHDIDDDNSDNSSGNDDGEVNPGEIIELYVTLRNQGSATATGVNATISTTDSYVTWLFNTASSYPDIPGGGTGTNTNDFDFEVDPSCPCDHWIHFDLTITASNGGPWTDSFDVQVVCEPRLEYHDHRIDDDNIGNSSGDDDGKIDPGEDIELYVTLRNDGGKTATGVNAYLDTTDVWVTWFDHTVTCPDIPPGSTSTCTDDFDFSVDPGCPCGHWIHFDLTITASNGGPWTDSFNEQVVCDQPPHLRYDDHDIDDDNTHQSSGNGDGRINPGETIELYAKLCNDGNAPATGVNATLSINDSYVTWPWNYNTSSTYPDIPAGGCATNQNDFDFPVDPSCPDGHLIHFHLDVTASNGGPWSISFSEPCVGTPELAYVPPPRIDDDNSGQSSGDGDGVVDPGEDIELYATLVNNGTGTATGVSAYLDTTDSYVTAWTDHLVTYPDIPAGGTATASDDFDFSVGNCPVGHVINFDLEITASNGGPWHDTVEVTCGSGTALRIEPPDQDVCIHDGPFDVDVKVVNVTSLGAFQFDLVYDPAMVQALDVDLGPFLSSSGCSVMEVGPNIDNTAGRLRFGGTILGVCTGPSGDGVMATVTLEPTDVGESDLVLENAQLLDSGDPPQHIPFDLYDGHVKVENCFFADVDRDGDVDIWDIREVARRWRCQCGDACYDPTYDLNDDCVISITDIQIVACYFGWPNGDFSHCYTPTGSGMAPLADQPSTLRLTPEEMYVQPGESFTVDLVVEKARDLAGFEAVLHYDPQVLRFDGLALGDFMASTGNTAEPLEAQVDLDAGTVTLGGFSLGEHDSPDGSGTLITLTFTAQGSGDSPLTLSSVQLASGCGLAQPAPTVVDGHVFSGDERVASTVFVYLPMVYK